MGRRRKHGRDIDGILLLDKPRHLTSNEALQRVKRKLEHYLETRNAEKETEPDEKAKEPIDRKAK